MDPRISEKIKQLRDYYYEDTGSLKVVEGFEKQARTLILKDKLMENQSVVAIVDEARKRVNLINTLLQTDSKMSEEFRQKLFTEKEVHQFYLDRFDNKEIEKRFESLEASLNRELDRIGFPQG